MEIMKKREMNDYNFINSEEMENYYVEYYLLKDNVIKYSYGQIIKKLTRNLYIVNDLETKENYKINKADIINRIEFIENKFDTKNEMEIVKYRETKKSKFNFYLIGFLILIGIGLSIFSFVSLESSFQKFINEVNISMFGLKMIG